MRLPSRGCLVVGSIVILMVGPPPGRGADERPGAAEAPPSSRSYLSVKQILADLPPEARPIPEAGWGSSAREQAEAWLSQHVAGGRIRLEAQLARVEVVEGESGSSWQVYFAFRTPPFVFYQAQVRPLVGAVGSNWPPGTGTGEGKEPIPDPLRVVVDESFGRRAREMKPGQSMRILGVIQSVTLEPADDANKAVHLVIRLVRYQVSSGRSAAKVPKS
ncbi:MAG: hypothetical protein OER86_00185 [Phycisphaerae bacterium]|nr:hypothetical protein [Phycisphaerae bacterium]